MLLAILVNPLTPPITLPIAGNAATNAGRKAPLLTLDAPILISCISVLNLLIFVRG